MDNTQEEYLTVAELSKRIKFSRQTIYNLISKQVFEINKHYIKPRPKKILFKWTQIRAWLEKPLESPVQASGTDCSEEALPKAAKEKAGRPESAIKI